MTEPLFEGFELDPRPATTSAERQRARQQACIDEGFHPLTLAIARTKPQGLYPGARSIPLHPKADRDAAAGDKAGLPFTCGSCALRTFRSRSQTYPKCSADYPDRVTGGPLTDVRAWWPACVDYQPNTTDRSLR